jgi:hypothetical protein
MRTHPSRLLPILIVLSLFAVPLLEAGFPAGQPLRVYLAGKLTLTPSDADSVTIEAQMRGLGTPFGPATALATWTTSATRLAGLQAGRVDELTIGSGTLVARTFLGTVAGPFSGTLRRLPSGAILFQSDFAIAAGSGFLVRARGSGRMLGVANPETLDFLLSVDGQISTR